MGPSRRSHKPLRRIAFNAVAVGLVVAMVIARMRSASGPSRVDAFDTAGPEPVEEQSPWCELRGRMLKLHRKERGVRAVVVAFALTIAGAAGIIASGKVLPHAQFLAPTVQGAELVTSSTAALVASMACAVIAWTLVISGLFLTRWQVRLGGLALLAAGAFAEWHEMGRDLSLFSGVLGLVAISGILALGLLTVAADVRAAKGKRSLDFRSRWLAPVTAVIIGLLVVLAYLGQAARVGGTSSAVEHTVMVVELVNIAAILIVPMLLIAGADVVDLGGDLANGIVWSLRQRRRVLTMTGVIAVGVLTAILLYGGSPVLFPALAAAPVLAIITVTAARARPFPRWKKPLPVLALAGLLFWLLFAGQVALGVVKPPRPVESVTLSLPVLDPGPPVFNFRAPNACARGARLLLGSPGVAGAVVANCRGLPYFYFEIWTSPGVQNGPCTLPRMTLHRENIARVSYTPASDEGIWHACAIDDTGDHQHGIAWTRSQAGRTWMAIALTDDQPGAYELQVPLLRQMRDSLRQSGTTPAPLPVPPRRVGGARADATILRNGDAAWLAVAVAAALILTLRKRRENSQAGAALLYLTCAGAWISLTGLIASAAGTKLQELQAFNMAVGGLTALAAIGTLGYLVARTGISRRSPETLPGRYRLPHKLGGLLVLDLSLLVIWAAAHLYETASRGGSSGPVLLGVVLLLALLWELASSGTMLNPGMPDSDVPDPPIPHRARVVAYVGFLTLTAAAVLELATLHSVSTGAPAGSFESETTAAAGIVEFGVPFAITAFLVRWFSAPADNKRTAPRNHAERS